MFKLKNRFSNHKKRRSGQALVETALFLPIFLVILAGIVEVSQYTITVNRLTSAARASTRFASNGGEDDGMLSALKNSVTNTMTLDEDKWDVFSIRGTINGDGSGFNDDWEFNHIYGISVTGRFTDVDEIAIQTQILEDLKFDEDGNRISAPDIPQELADLRIVGTYVIHDLESILNLDATPAVSSIYSVAQLNVMRISGINIESSEGCAAFPIALGQIGARSLTPTDSGGNRFPAAGEFDYPLPPPTYQQFVRHQDDIGLDDGTPEGTVFRYYLGTTNANFGWLIWNQQIAPTNDVLANSLKWPGDSLDFTDHGDAGNPHPEYNYVIRGYSEPGDSTNLDMHIGERVAQAPTGLQLSPDITFGAVNQSLNENISLSRDLRLVVFDSIETATSSYIIKRFGIFKVQGYGNASLGNEWLLLEFIRWDDTCGQVNEPIN